MYCKELSSSEIDTRRDFKILEGDRTKYQHYTRHSLPRTTIINVLLILVRHSLRAFCL